MPYAEVAVAAGAPFTQAFTYRVPDGMVVEPGDAVLAPFGRRRVPGIVLAVAETSAFAGETRDLLLGGERLLLPHQIDLTQWLARTYFAPIADCAGLMLPPEAERRLTDTVEWCAGPPPPGLSPADARIAARLASSGRATPVALRRSFGGAADAAVLRFEAAGWARRSMRLPLPSAGVAPAGPRVTAATAVSPPRLSVEQTAAGRQIAAALDRRDGTVFLLHGVTGSGKTEVYLAAIAAAWARGRRSVLLVPEIALTPQTVARVEARFPAAVAVSHSGLTPSQRYRQWHEVRAGRCVAVVGARSALFLPVPDLGLIVLDEEHEWSYKQQSPPPRYHAREAALHLARTTGATVVLGSATPDVTSYWRAERGHFRLLRLPDRVAGPGQMAACQAGTPAPPPLPPVTVIDLAAELRAGNRGIFSRALDEALRAVLRNGEQAILFLNRRGSASFLLCRDCGFVPRCAACLVPYTYHAVAERLRCHHCNRQRRVPATCPQCGSTRFRFLGLGTQRVEEEVRRRYPEARVLRWDRDTVRTGAGHEAMLTAFARREADILVGTQMVAKGLDLPGVTLAGVVTADIALNLPDYRAGERAFQLLTQVAGRAGRGDRHGRAIIQTYTPGHYAVRAAAHHDYAAMYRDEIALRGRAGYPPFGRLARLVYGHRQAPRAEEEARRLARDLLDERRRRGIPGVQVIGPAPAQMERLRGVWRWQLLIRAADPGELLRAISIPHGWAIDVDPASFL